MSHNPTPWKPSPVITNRTTGDTGLPASRRMAMSAVANAAATSHDVVSASSNRTTFTPCQFFGVSTAGSEAGNRAGTTRKHSCAGRRGTSDFADRKPPGA